jgi:hypothetical protein
MYIDECVGYRKLDWLRCILPAWYIISMTELLAALAELMKLLGALTEVDPWITITSEKIALSPTRA